MKTGGGFAVLCLLSASALFEACVSGDAEVVAVQDEGGTMEAASVVAMEDASVQASDGSITDAGAVDDATTSTTLDSGTDASSGGKDASSTTDAGVDAGSCVGSLCNGGTVTLTPAMSSQSFTASIVAPGSGNHSYTKYDIDVSAFVDGGTIKVNGVLAPGGCDGSFELFAAATPYPTTGPVTTAVAYQKDVPNGTMWSFQYVFAPTTLFHLGAEGNWFSVAGTPNKTSVIVSVGP
jgi:hypothetical protein